jgi:tape measure domain-containing protein
MAARDLNVVLGLRVENFQKNLRSAQRQMERFGRDMQRLGSNLTQTLTLPILGAGGAAVSSAIQFEQLEARLRVLTGSAEEGAAVFERIKTFAAQTPFEVTDLVEASSQLMAFGFSADEALNSLQYLGDIAAATGSNINDISLILGQARTVGVAFTQDLRQLASRGIPVFEMLQKETGLTGKAFNEFVADGGVTFDVLNRLLQETASEGGKFFGGMQMQSQTLGGALSNFKDSASIAFAELGKSIAESTNLNERLRQLSDFISALVQRFKELTPEAKQTAVNIALFVSAIGPAVFIVGKLATTIGGLLGQMRSLVGIITTLAGPVGIALALVGIITAMYFEFENVRKVVNGLLQTFYAFLNTVIQLGKQLVNFTSLLGAIQSGNVIRIKVAFDELKDGISELPDAVANGFKNISFTDAENKVTSFLDRIKQQIFGVKTEAAKVIPSSTQTPTSTPSGSGGGIDTSQAYATQLLPTFATPEGIASISAATEQLNTYNTELQETSGFTEQVNNTFGFIQNSITPIIDGVFNALEAGQNVFKSLARGVKDLVVQLIKAVAQAAILSAIMNILFPGLGAARGAFSFRSILGGSLGIPGLASGGLVTGPTMALVGEGSGTSLSNPEVVAPLDRLRSMLDNGMNQSGFIAETRIQGSDLLLSIERAERNRNR